MPQFGGTPLHARIVQLHSLENEDDLIHQVIGKVADTPRDLATWLRASPNHEKGKPDLEVPMTCWSDWHLGEVVEAHEVHNYNTYSMAIAEARIQNCSTRQSISRASISQPCAATMDATPRSRSSSATPRKFQLPHFADS